MSKIVFITGATAGFGEAAAKKFASQGYRLIINGRRTDRLKKLHLELHEQFGCSILELPFDVQNRQAVFSAIDSLTDDWKNIDVLVNNAGLALGRDYFDEADLDDWDTMIDTNVKGAMYVAKAVSMLMATRKQGHIINMGSVAAKIVYEKGNAYCASKFAIDALSQSMRIDLMRHNIKVTCIHPGAAETEFSNIRFKGDEKVANAVYKGLKPLTAEDIADIIFYCSSLPPHVCINDLTVSCMQQANAYYFLR